jgi:hypothetical protein
MLKLHKDAHATEVQSRITAMESVAQSNALKKQRTQFDYLLRSRIGPVVARAGTTRRAEKAADSQAPPHRASEIRSVVSSNLFAVHDGGSHIPSLEQSALGWKIASAFTRRRIILQRTLILPCGECDFHTRKFKILHL